MDLKQTKSNRNLWFIFFLLSIGIFIFLFWWLYAKESASSQGLTWVQYLPYLNCTLNLLTAVLLCVGLSFIKAGKQKLHRNTMITAGLTSALFLVSYLTYHHFQGDTKFLGQGLIRPIYFFTLISHIVLSMAQVPLILATFTFAFMGRWTTHRKVAKITFPIWLYVSITGVLIFFMLKII